MHPCNSSKQHTNRKIQLPELNPIPPLSRALFPRLNCLGRSEKQRSQTVEKHPDGIPATENIRYGEMDSSKTVARRNAPRHSTARHPSSPKRSSARWTRSPEEEGSSWQRSPPNFLGFERCERLLLISVRATGLGPASTARIVLRLVEFPQMGSNEPEKLSITQSVGEPLVRSPS